MTITTESYERGGFPRATATLDSETGALTCVVDQITGLAPQRSVSAEELLAGIDSLDPPTVHAYTVRELIDLAQLAVEAAAESTIGSGTGPELVLGRYKVAVSVKGALAALGVSV